MSNELQVISQAMPSQARSDEHLLQLFLHGRSPDTIRYYRSESERFLQFVGKPLRQVTLDDLQQFVDSLTGADSSRARALATVKSLLSFGQRLGYLQFNIGAALQKKNVRNNLSLRILTESQVIHMIALEKNPRDRALIRTLYLAALRRSELSRLRWTDMIERDHGEGQITVYGKGGKTRVVLIPASLWAELKAIRGDAGQNDPVFLSLRKGAICPEHVNRIVQTAAKRAGLPENVSAHWLRHAHASHALDRGAPPHLVQATLGHASLQTTSVYAHARPTESSAKYLPS